MADKHRVEPAAAPPPPGINAILMAFVAEQLPDLVREFSRERPTADARRISLGNAEHIADRLWTET